MIDKDISCRAVPSDGHMMKLPIVKSGHERCAKLEKSGHERCAKHIGCDAIKYVSLPRAAHAYGRSAIAGVLLR